MMYLINKAMPSFRMALAKYTSKNYKQYYLSADQVSTLFFTGLKNGDHAYA